MPSAIEIEFTVTVCEPTLREAKVDAGVSADQILQDKKDAEEAEILSEKNSNDSEEDEDTFEV